jgi:hypothetical protein
MLLLCTGSRVRRLLFERCLLFLSHALSIANFSFLEAETLVRIGLSSNSGFLVFFLVLCSGKITLVSSYSNKNSNKLTN